MSANNQFDQILTLVENRVAHLSNDVGVIREKLEGVKTFEDVVSSKEAKKEVGAEVDRHSVVFSRISDISVNLIRVRTLRKGLAQGEVPPALVQKMLARVDRLVKDMEDLRTAYQSLGSAYEARLRFYNSCTYHM